MELSIEENSKKIDKADEQLVLVEYHEYLDISSKEKAHRFPKLRPWDHQTEMKEGFEPKSFKTTTLHRLNKSNWTNSSKKTFEKGIFGHPNCQWPPRFSLFLRRTANFDHVKITSISIPYHLFWK
jgi:hypothetical protein